MVKSERGMRASVTRRSAARLLVAFCVVFAGVATVGRANAGPASLTCTTDISGTVTANVVVPSGEVCALLAGAVVYGNIAVEKAATLFVDDGVTINGNVEARSGSGVLMGEGTTLNGSYGASDAASAIVNAAVNNNVTFSGGSYGLVGEVSGRLTCSGSATGASLTPGASSSGCVVADPLTVLGYVISAAQKASGGSGGSKTKPLTCNQAITAAGVWLAISDMLQSIPGCESNATCSTEADFATGVADGLLTASCGNPT